MALSTHQALDLVWKDLGLAGATLVEADIKRAYALRVREVRPDTDPDGFERLQAARDYALAEIRYRSIAQRIGFADFSGEPNPTYTDAAYPLGDRIALLIANGTERIRRMNWNAVLDELAHKPMSERMSTGADLGEQMLRAHGCYERGAAYRYPKSQPLLFERNLMEFIMKGVDWTALEQRDLIDPEALRWLFIRTGLSNGTWEAPVESRTRPRIFLTLKIAAVVLIAAIVGLLGLAGAHMAGLVDAPAIWESIEDRIPGMGEPERPVLPRPRAVTHVPDRPAWITISHLEAEQP